MLLVLIKSTLEPLINRQFMLDKKSIEGFQCNGIPTFFNNIIFQGVEQFKHLHQSDIRTQTISRLHINGEEWLVLSDSMQSTEAFTKWQVLTPL